jgi:hypothetical protein
MSGWENFYVIVGSSAGALIGLQFVVMTLIATRPIGSRRIRNSNDCSLRNRAAAFGNRLRPMAQTSRGCNFL